MSQKTAREWFEEGDALKSKNKFEEALKCFEQAISLKADSPSAYSRQAFCLKNLGRLDEAVRAMDNAIQYNPKVAHYVNKALILEQLNKTEQALECFNEAISCSPSSADAHFEKGNLLNRLKRRPEALECYKEAVRVQPNYDKGYHNIGSVYYSMKKYEDAVLQYNEAIRLNPDNALSLCWRGNCYLALEQKENAMRDFRKAQQLVQSDQAVKMYSSDNLKYIKRTLKSVLELDDMVVNTRDIFKGLSNSNPFFQRMAANIKALEEAQAQTANTLLKPEGKDDPSETDEINKKTEELRKENDELRRLVMERLNKIEQNEQKLKQKIDNIDKRVVVIDNKVEQLAFKVDDIIKELNLKMTDYNKKMNIEVGRLVLSDDDKNKLKQYYNAFVSTFSSAYATAQVVDSGQVSLDSGTAVTSTLSFLSSYIPFVGSYFELVTSIMEFLETKEMKMNARKMKSLANSADYLSQIIGNVALNVVLEPSKRSEILGMTEADLRKDPRNVMDKILNFCDRVSEEIDAYLYTRLYNVPAAFLGQKDANRLIEAWTKGLPLTNIEEKFKELALSKEDDNKQTLATTPSAGKSDPLSSKRRSCCNMF